MKELWNIPNFSLQRHGLDKSSWSTHVLLRLWQFKFVQKLCNMIATTWWLHLFIYLESVVSLNEGIKLFGVWFFAGVLREIEFPIFLNAITIGTALCSLHRLLKLQHALQSRFFKFFLISFQVNIQLLKLFHSFLMLSLIRRNAMA